MEERLGLELDAARQPPWQPAPGTDWIWDSGNGAESLAESIGMVLLAATEVVSSAASAPAVAPTEAPAVPVQAPAAFVAPPAPAVPVQAPAAFVPPPAPAVPVQAPAAFVAPPAPVVPVQAPAAFVPVHSPVAPPHPPVAPVRAPAAFVAPPPTGLPHELPAPLVEPASYVAPLEPWRPTPAVAAPPGVIQPTRSSAVSAALAQLRPLLRRSATVRLQSSRAHVAYRAFGWVRNIGLIVILFAIWQLWGTTIAEHQAQSTLKTEFEAKVHSDTTSSQPASLIPASTRVTPPPSGTVVGQLRIPAIGVSQFVVEGTAEQDLAKGPGHYTGTAEPGQAGNVAIAGHRTTYGAPFYHLNDVVPGDAIYLTTDSGEQLTYVVARPPVAVSPKDVSVINYFGDNRLTLTTCNPVFSASQRLVLVAYLQGALNKTGGPEPAKLTVPTVTTGLSGWRWSYLPESLALIALLVLLGLGYEKITARVGKLGRWLVLVPLWLAGLYLLFSALASLLPASV